MKAMPDRIVPLSRRMPDGVISPVMMAARIDADRKAAVTQTRRLRTEDVILLEEQAARAPLLARARVGDPEAVAELEQRYRLVIRVGAVTG